uniref:Uncharacterized protein n=1 Tax=virus sp. ctx9V1 TaxID=2828001 RepID=A0A8S5RDA1_9VIRU|nr:MAG TPA: hypothetical protein [virus sp. ctx9V1]
MYLFSIFYTLPCFESYTTLYPSNKQITLL